MMHFETIPGETPIDDVSGLKIPGLSTRAELSKYEAQNIVPVMVKYLAARPSARIAPFTANWMKKLHREMFGEVWTWAGSFRRSNTNIGIDWPQIEQHMYMLEEDLTAWKMPVPERAAVLHHRAVQIHPFENGNGRWARLLANILQSRNGCSVTEWPEQHIGAESVIRSDYLVAIRQGDQGDLAPLIDLHQRFTRPDRP